MDTATLISLCAVGIAFLGLILTSRKDTRQDAASVAEMKATLGSISNGVEDIRVEFRAMRETVSGHGARISAIEQDCKNLHHRVDALDGQKKGT